MRHIETLKVCVCAVTLGWLLAPAGADNLIVKVPDWDQPLDHGVNGYPGWCSPTAGADLVGYWEDKRGMSKLADSKLFPVSVAYPDNADTFRQNRWHDGTVELGWQMDTGDWRTNWGPFPPGEGGTELDMIGPGVVRHVTAMGWQAGVIGRCAFSAVASMDNVNNQATWQNYVTEINNNRPVLVSYEHWVADPTGEERVVKDQTVHLYNLNVTGLAHTVCGVGYLDATPGQFNGDEWVIGQDNWLSTPRYVAVPFRTLKWMQNDYITIRKTPLWWPLSLANQEGPIIPGSLGAAVPRTVIQMADGNWGMYFSEGDACTYRDTGLAISTNGQTWTRVGPAMTHESGGASFDDTAAVITQVICQNDGKLRAYCEGLESTGLDEHGVVFIAESLDGLTWSNRYLVLSPQPGTGYSRHVTCPRVYVTDTAFVMYFLGEDDAGISRIFLTTSSDGVNWASGTEVVLPTELTAPGAFEIVQRGDEGALGMYLHSSMSAGATDIFALQSDDGLTWTLDDPMPVLSATAYGVSDLLYPTVYDVDGNAVMLVGGGYAGTTPHWDIFSATLVPEPATLALLALGGLALIRRRK